MGVSLIVGTVGRIEPLRRLLTSLRNSTTAAAEIIVVDQNPTGFLDEVLAGFPDLPIMHLASALGLSRARNVGLAAAGGDIVAFPDDDCWYPPGLVSRVESLFSAEPGLSMVTGRTVDEEGKTSVSPHQGESADVTRANVFQIGNSNGLFVQRSLAQAIDGFDEMLGVGAASPYQSGEETDFVLRCLAVGAICRYDHTLLINHSQADIRTPQHLDRIRGYSAGFGRVLRIHGYRRSVVATTVVRAGVRALMCVACLDFEGASQRRAWIAGTLRGFTASI